MSFEDLGARAEEFSHIINHSDDDICLVGWSMGGMVAMQLAVKYPEKIKALVLVSTTPKFISCPDLPQGLSLAILRKLQKRIKREGISAFHSLIFDLSHEIPGLADLSSDQIANELRELEQLDLRHSLAAIKVPTLIIHGANDEICPPEAAQYLHEKISGSELIIMPGVGHVPQIDATEIFNSIIKDFMAKHDR